jgi:site-specific DNA recombinase
MKKEKEADQKKLADLGKAKESLAKLEEYENKLKELCSRIAPDIENCTNQDKKDAYTYLDLAIKATPEGVDVKGYLDPSVLTTGRTWA